MYLSNMYNKRTTTQNNGLGTNIKYKGTSNFKQ